ncbi:hypothetical protein CLAIMM_11668 [Cladophialophora immunda]|nr:hypothetical protein CLAIMM_11668 [Cladophialophora immunda]
MGESSLSEQVDASKRQLDGRDWQGSRQVAEQLRLAGRRMACQLEIASIDFRTAGNKIATLEMEIAEFKRKVGELEQRNPQPATENLGSEIERLNSVLQENSGENIILKSENEELKRNPRLATKDLRPEAE